MRRKLSAAPITARRPRDPRDEDGKAQPYLLTMIGHWILFLNNCLLLQQEKLSFNFCPIVSCQFSGTISSASRKPSVHSRKKLVFNLTNYLSIGEWNSIHFTPKREWRCFFGLVWFFPKGKYFTKR